MDEHRENFRETRRELLETLGEVIDVALRKYSKVTVRSRDRCSWGRLVVSSVSESGKLLRDTDIDDLLRRLEHLEREVKKKL